MVLKPTISLGQGAAFMASYLLKSDIEETTLTSKKKLKKYISPNITLTIMILGRSIADSPAQWEHMNQKEKDRLSQFHKKRLKMFPATESAKLLRLQKVLLKAAGDVLAIHPEVDPDIDKILDRGVFGMKMLPI